MDRYTTKIRMVKMMIDIIIVKMFWLINEEAKFSHHLILFLGVKYKLLFGMSQQSKNRIKG